MRLAGRAVTKKAGRMGRSHSSHGRNRKPAHQNKFAFRHNKNSKKTRVILSSPTGSVCPRCLDIILWKKKFRKYKPLTQPKKCLTCSKRKIKQAYHIHCKDCCRKHGMCGKCGKKNADFSRSDEGDAEMAMAGIDSRSARKGWAKKPTAASRPSASSAMDIEDNKTSESSRVAVAAAAEKVIIDTHATCTEKTMSEDREDSSKAMDIDRA